jgi:hypothetical protein
MMLLLALLIFLGGMTLFGNGPEVVPSSGTGEVLRAPAAPGKARLLIKRVVPKAIIAGTGFKSGEVVRLTGVPVRQVRTSARGTFTIRVSVDPCRSLSVTAIGSKGSRAAVNYSQFNCALP